MVRYCTYLGKNMTSVVDAEYESLFTFVLHFPDLYMFFASVRSYGPIGRKVKLCGCTLSRCNTYRACRSHYIICQFYNNSGNLSAQVLINVTYCAFALRALVFVS